MVIGSALLGPYALGTLFLFFAIVGLFEMFNLFRKKEVLPRFAAGLGIGFLMYVLIWLSSVSDEWNVYAWLIPVSIVVFFATDLIKLRPTSMMDIAATLFSVVYVIFPFSLVNKLAMVTGDFEYALPLGFFLILWTNDSGAYFTGKYLGKHKLYESVSPNKTWEGLFGGIALSFVVAFALSELFDVLSLPQWMVVAFIIAIFANVGDLFESRLKRLAGVKDSGQLIPGHGGVLDRFDGLLLALPIVVAYLHFIFS